MTSRIRILADQIRLGTAEGTAGDLIFEAGTVNGVAGTVLRSALIGDLTVDTLQLENESVTLPGLVTFGGGSGSLQSVPSFSWTTKMEDSFEVTTLSGATIYLQIQADIYAGGQGDSNSALSQRLLLNDSVTLASWYSPLRERKVIARLATATGTGSAQSFNLKWQVYGHWPVGGTSFVYLNEAKMFRVAMKR
jgi:hypothetical protein